MRAVQIREPGGPDVLRPVEMPVPEPADDEVLIEVAAAGVNRPDVLQRMGRYPLPKDASPLPGLEVAGRVVAVGSGAERYRAGDAVMALTRGGGYAEYCAVHEAHCLPVPDSLTLTEAAAVPETFFTVQYNLFMRAGLGAGETLLVHGGSSGIGSTAIQLAGSRGARVVTTAGSAAKCRFCESLGADLAIDYKREDWAAVVDEWTEGRGVDVVLDMVAGDYLQKNLNVLARDGRCVIIAFLGGSRSDIDMRPLVAKRLTLTGSTLRPQTTAEKAAIAGELAEHVMPLLSTGAVKPIVFRRYALEEAGLAHELMESSEHMGKIVLDVRGPRTDRE